MKAYIATRLERAADHNFVRDRLGLPLTYDWTEHGSVKHDTHLLVKVATKEAFGVTRADLFIGLLPGGRGTHTELGIAIASRVPRIILIAEDPRLFGTGPETSAFYHHPTVHNFAGDLADACRYIKGLWL